MDYVRSQCITKCIQNQKSKEALIVKTTNRKV